MDVQDVFEEWDTYAQKRELKTRDVNFNSITKNSKLKIIAVTGIRRSGKTSSLILLHQMLSKEGKKVGYINLEDTRIKDSKAILDEALKWFGDSGYLLLDEITSVYDWSSWLARNHEMLKGKLHIVVSSSRKGLTVPTKPLRGRIMVYELYPFSFREFLQFNNIRIEKTTAGIGKIEKALNDYLIYGGFPEVVLIKEKTEKIKIVSAYFKDIVTLDVAEIAKENISTVETFGKYVIETSHFSASKCLNFFKSMGYKIGKQTLLNLEKCASEGYLFFFVPVFSHTMKDRSQYPRKSYLGDSGFMYAVSGKTDMGRLFENVIFLELKRRLEQNQEINYWKNVQGYETDFVIRKGLKTEEIIQSVYDISNEKTKEREVRALVICAKELGVKHGLVITKDSEGLETTEGVKIKFIPLWKWLLGIK